MTRTRMSSDGAVIIPKAVRDAHGLSTDSEFEVIDGGSEITLRLVKNGHRTTAKNATLEEFLTSRPSYDGPPVSDEMIRDFVVEEARRRWDEKNSR